MAIRVPEQLEDIEISDELRLIKERLTELAADAAEIAKAQAAAMAADPEDVIHDVSAWARRPSTRIAAKYLATGTVVGGFITAIFLRRRRKRTEIESSTDHARPTPIPEREDAQAS